MDIFKCTLGGELFAYLPACGVEDEYNLPDEVLDKIEHSKKGEVVRAEFDAFENIGSIEELVAENARLKEEKLILWKKWVSRGHENARLSYNLGRLSEIIRKLLIVIPINGVTLNGDDIADDTGRVLSK